MSTIVAHGSERVKQLAGATAYIVVSAPGMWLHAQTFVENCTPPHGCAHAEGYGNKKERQNAGRVQANMTVLASTHW